MIFGTHVVVTFVTFRFASALGAGRDSRRIGKVEAGDRGYPAAGVRPYLRSGAGGLARR